MSVADDMFKKLGYKKNPDSSKIYTEYYKYDKEDKNIKQIISFDNKYRTVMCFIESKDVFNIMAGVLTIPELKAVNRKVKELWDA